MRTIPFLSTSLSTAALTFCLASAPVSAADTTKTTTSSSTTINASTSNAAMASDGNYVTVSGKVTKLLGGGAFDLDYGGGTIKVDTNNDWPSLFSDKNKDAMVKVGDRVRVSGRVDDTWLTRKEIEADYLTITRNNTSTIYWNEAGRKTDTYVYDNDSYFRDGARFGVNGVITEIKNDDEFILSYGGGNTIQVDMAGLTSVEKDNLNKLRVGERVSVYGKFDKNVFERNELRADIVQHSGVYRYNRN